MFPHPVTKTDSNSTFTFHTTCISCGIKQDISITEKEHTDYISGAPIQEAFPLLCPNAREILISGICGTCYDKMFYYKEEEQPPHL